MSLILLIEDNPNNARMVSKILKRRNFDIQVCEDGESGLKAAFESQPDIILIDLGLPDIDGQTVLGVLNQQEHLKDVPFIAFTAWPESTVKGMVEAYGCDGVLTKPINVKTFADQIQAFIDEAKKNTPTSQSQP